DHTLEFGGNQELLPYKSPLYLCFFRHAMVLILPLGPSGVDASHSSIISHTVNTKHVSGRPCVYRMSIRIPATVIKICDHCVLKSLINNVFAPKVTHPVLSPFKVRHGNPPRIREDVGNHKNPFFMQHFVSGSRGWSVCTL